jgi:ProQ/FINO family
LEAIIQGNWRYGLNGEKVEAIIQKHKNYAAEKLAVRKNKFKKTRSYKGRRIVGKESEQREGSNGQPFEALCA